ncbi:MAG: hypothetical protein QM725_06970 [Lacibacter sp.]
MNIFVISITVIVCIALLVFFIVRNQKDEKKFEQQLKDDFRKSKNEEGDSEIDNVLK